MDEAVVRIGLVLGRRQDRGDGHPPVGRRHRDLVLHQPGPVADAAVIARPGGQPLGLPGDAARVVQLQAVDQRGGEAIAGVDRLDRQDGPPRLVPDLAVHAGGVLRGRPVLEGHPDHRPRVQDLAEAQRARRLERLVGERHDRVDVLGLDGPFPGRDQGIDVGRAQARRQGSGRSRVGDRPPAALHAAHRDPPPLDRPPLQPQQDPGLERVRGDLQLGGLAGGLPTRVEPAARLRVAPEVVGGERGAEVGAGRQRSIGRGARHPRPPLEGEGLVAQLGGERGRRLVDADADARVVDVAGERDHPADAVGPDQPALRRAEDPEREVGVERPGGHAMLERRQHHGHLATGAFLERGGDPALELAARRRRDPAHDDVPDQVVGQPRGAAVVDREPPLHEVGGRAIASIRGPADQALELERVDRPAEDREGPEQQVGIGAEPSRPGRHDRVDVASVALRPREQVEPERRSAGPLPERRRLGRSDPGPTGHQPDAVVAVERPDVQGDERATRRR